MGFFAFGDVIRFKGALWVYLAGTADTTYLAKIIGGQDAQIAIRLRKHREEMATQGHYGDQKKLDQTIFAFVILTTKEFNECIAHYEQAGHDNASLRDALPHEARLNVEDANALRIEILESRGVAREVKDRIAKLGEIEEENLETII